MKGREDGGRWVLSSKGDSLGSSEGQNTKTEMAVIETQREIYRKELAYVFTGPRSPKSAVGKPESQESRLF